MELLKEMTLEEKKRQVRERLEKLLEEDCCVAFSGGADSSLLLSLACEAAGRRGRRVYGVLLVTALHPAEDRETARRVAGEIGACYRELLVDELKEAGIENNPPDRCYRCKRLLFRRLTELARGLGCGAVLEGTNGDDLGQYRPGLRAVRELGVISPLAEAGLTKAEVRAWSRERGISVAERPASPCMATRLPYGQRLELEVLKRIEEGEAYLRGLGFAQVRLRVHGNLARIEVLPEQLARLAGQALCVTEHLRELGFSYVTMDLQGFRSGSMDESLPADRPEGGDEGGNESQRNRRSGNEGGNESEPDRRPGNEGGNESRRNRRPGSEGEKNRKRREENRGERDEG